MDLGVRDRGYLVVGGTRGIGLAAAEALAADGARVAVVGRDAAHSTEVAHALGERFGTPTLGLAGDVSAPGVAEVLTATAAEAFGGLRGVAVTTGLGPDGHRDLAASDAEWTSTFNDVVLGTVHVCQAAVAHLRAGGGSIVTTAAYSVRSPKGHQLPYASMKAAVVTLTKALAKSYGPDGIRANCVCPGATETDVMAAMRAHYAAEKGWPVQEALERAMTEEWGMAPVALGRAGRPDEVGDVIAFLLSERGAYTTGALVNVDGGTDF